MSRNAPGVKEKFRKTIIVLVFFGVIPFLMLRIFDLGVTLDFTRTQLLEITNRTHIIAKYQREPCLSAYQQIDGVSVFRKEGNIVVRGVTFACYAKTNDVPRLYLIDK